MNRIHQSPAGRRDGSANFIATDERFVVQQLRYFYRRLRKAGVAADLARNTVWMSCWLGTLPCVNFLVAPLQVPA